MSMRRGTGHARYGGARYEVVNRDTAITIAHAAAADGAEAMVFVSAAAAPPGVDARYILSKREAEEVVRGSSRLSSFTLHGHCFLVNRQRSGKKRNWLFFILSMLLNE